MILYCEADPCRCGIATGRYRQKQLAATKLMVYTPHMPARTVAVILTLLAALTACDGDPPSAAEASSRPAERSDPCGPGTSGGAPEASTGGESSGTGSESGTSTGSDPCEGYGPNPSVTLVGGIVAPDYCMGVLENVLSCSVQDVGTFTLKCEFACGESVQLAVSHPPSGSVRIEFIDPCDE